MSPPRAGSRFAPGQRRHPRRPAASAAEGLTGTELTLQVGAVAAGGACVARHEGRAVFVRHALPGETVRARVTEDRGRYLRADAVAVEVASPDRVTAPCPWAGPGRCGGCDWQHATPAAQRGLKADVVREQLVRLGRVPAADPLLAALVVEQAPGTPDNLGWRTRVQWALDAQGRPGLHRHRSDALELVDQCLIAHPLVTDVGVERQVWPDTAAVEVVVGAGTGDRSLVVVPRPARGPVAVPPLEVTASVQRGDGRGSTAPVHGRPGVRERALGRIWRVSGSGFWQVHPDAADTLAAAVLAALEPADGETALDLYAGVGVLGGALAAGLGSGSVTLVEADPVAADDARHNLADVPGARVETGRVDAVLPRLGLRHVDLVVLDPPRAGAGPDVSARVAGLSPRRVAYLSCDPAPLARDLAAFAGAGYRLVGLRAFDLFPMTQHVECLAVLEPAG